MHELRLVGVHEDGRHLLLADAQGARFQVPVDDALRTAVRHLPSSPGKASAQASADVGPREVQALIRAGLTTEEVAERSGWTVEKVRRYEVPILAEREYVTGLARLVRLRHRGSTSHPTLAARVDERLRTRGVDAHLGWDSFRPPGSLWNVVVTFAAGGRQRQATWSFDPVTRVLHAEDDEARWLSEDDPSPTGLLGREVPVYDVEADGGVQDQPSPRAAAPAAPTAPSVPVDLVTAMRQRTSARHRSGARRRVEPDAAPVDAQALPVPPPPVDTEDLPPPQPPVDTEALPLPPTPVGALPPGSEESEQVRQEAHDETGGALAATDEPAAPADSGERDEPAAEPAKPPRAARSSRRSTRTPVPAWREVVLGTKPASD